jgi:Protein of unknown function (DUF3489)
MRHRYGDVVQPITFFIISLQELASGDERHVREPTRFNRSNRPEPARDIATRARIASLVNLSQHEVIQFIVPLGHGQKTACGGNRKPKLIAECQLARKGDCRHPETALWQITPDQAGSVRRSDRVSGDSYKDRISVAGHTSSCGRPPAISTTPASRLPKDSRRIERIQLLLPGTRVMNVMTAGDTRGRRLKMKKANAEKTSTTTPEAATAVAEQGAHVAPEKTLSKKGATAKKGAPKGQKEARATAPRKAATKKEARAAKTTAKPARAKKPAAATASGPREGSKISRVIELLKRDGGVTLTELMAEMNWQSHTTRALMSAGGSLAKKHGLAVVSTKGENGDRIYAIGAA